MRHSSIRAKGDVAQILIYEDIGEGFFGGLGALAFRQQIEELPSSVASLTIRINSDGGDVFEGAAIYNTLKEHPAKKNVIIDGMAASVASVIAMAGDTITIQPTGMMMIHNAQGGAFGDYNVHQQITDVLKTINDQMAGAYGRSGKSKQDILDLMNATTWYGAQAAVDAGFVDSLVAHPLKLAASLKNFDLKAFGKVPDWVKQLQAASPSADQGCSCLCTLCTDGDCAACDQADCDCEGCADCPQMSSNSTRNEQISAITKQKALSRAHKRAENLRLAALC